MLLFQRRQRQYPQAERYFREKALAKPSRRVFLNRAHQARQIICGVIFHGVLRSRNKCGGQRGLVFEATKTTLIIPASSVIWVQGARSDPHGCRRFQFVFQPIRAVVLGGVNGDADGFVDPAAKLLVPFLVF